MPERIKILHLIKSLGRGGAEMLLPETLKLHNRSLFDFHYGYFLSWKNQMVDALKTQGGTVTCFSANSNLALMLQARAVMNYIKQHKVNLIHAHLPWAGILARVVGKMTSVPVIYTEHNKQERYHFATRLVNIATVNMLSDVVAVSDDVAESLVRHKQKLKARLHILLNGVNTHHFNLQKVDNKSVRLKLGIPAESPVIGTVAVFRFQKRLDLWLTLCVKILKDNPDTHFIIVGDGPLKQMLLDKRQQLGLVERVHFTGLQEEIRPYLAAFDIYMMSSVFEGLPIALLEAMSCGLPVISTDAGGIKEVISHGVNGLLTSINEPGNLTAYATSLISDKKAQAVLGSNARKRIQEAFSMEKMVQELERLYFNTLKY